MAYRVAVTNDYAEADGNTIFGDIGLHRLVEAGLTWEVLPEPMSPLQAHALEGYDAVIVLGPERVTAESIPASGRLRHVARFGAGVDAIDVGALVAQSVTLTNTPEAVRRPMAHTAVTLLLGLAHNVLVKDQLVRTGRWAERNKHRGRGLDAAIVGIIGLGGIGEEAARMVRALGADVVAYNRSDRSAVANAIGVQMLPLDEVCRVSDFVIVTVAANAATHHLIGDRQLELLGENGRLINIARGSVVDQDALIRRLQDGSIAGAGLDVFSEEPLSIDNPLTALDNVILAPHSLCWTDGFTRAVSTSVMDAVIDVASGRAPAHPVRPESVHL